MTTLEIDDDGWADISINGAAAQVDLYAAYNRLLAFEAETRESHPDEKAGAARQVAYLDRVAAYLNSLGFGAVSHRAADKFDAALTKAVAALGKADAPAPTPD
jgi:hypothetical protein